MQGALDTGAIVFTEGTDTANHVVDILQADFRRTQHYLTVGITGLRLASQVEDHLQQLIAVFLMPQGFSDMRWQNTE